MEITQVIMLTIAILMALFAGALSVFTDKLHDSGVMIGRAITAQTNPFFKISLLSEVKSFIKYRHWLMANAFLQTPKFILIVGCIVTYLYVVKVGSFAFLLVYFLGMFRNKKTPWEFRYYLSFYITWLTRFADQYETRQDTSKANSLRGVIVDLVKMQDIYKDSFVGTPYKKEIINNAPLGDMHYIKKMNPLFF